WCFYTQAYKNFLSSDTRDKRTKVSYETFYDIPKKSTVQWINKLAGTWESGTRIFDADVVVYRYADALLFKAEIENALGNTSVAITELNKIAKRAYGVDNYYASTLSAAEVNDKILVERMKEFAAEGKTWWDFIRFGVAFTKVPSLVGRQNEQNILLWPVSSESINGNPKIKQTPGFL
ncbi:RagB/SusD family nutrient uptake outer membrane protein, partial [bacterium]|nr:RagB/SusD family nutrient uptake outer membrane protein [bacterium]